LKKIRRQQNYPTSLSSEQVYKIIEYIAISFFEVINTRTTSSKRARLDIIIKNWEERYFFLLLIFFDNKKKMRKKAIFL